MKADAIIEKILEDARQSASKTLAEAGETVEKMRAKAEEESAARKQAAREKARQVGAPQLPQSNFGRVFSSRSAEASICSAWAMVSAISVSISSSSKSQSSRSSSHRGISMR